MMVALELPLLANETVHMEPPSAALTAVSTLPDTVMVKVEVSVRVSPGIPGGAV